MEGVHLGDNHAEYLKKRRCTNSHVRLEKCRPVICDSDTAGPTQLSKWPLIEKHRNLARKNTVKASPSMSTTPTHGRPGCSVITCLACRWAIPSKRKSVYGCMAKAKVNNQRTRLNMKRGPMVVIEGSKTTMKIKPCNYRRDNAPWHETPLPAS